MFSYIARTAYLYSTLLGVLFRALDALLGQMTSNMGEVTNLRLGLEDRLSKHVDVREALMKKKDEQLQGTMYIYVIVFLCSL